ncbi:GTPase-activating protein [Dimargaris verticillata]|uniref:GTPase-activating protein n=1 Tax=Dimargaris verticillata TaxID=2761393 RepID=A0A9W8AZT5_9FUNG|nr:GTPase-activating protein [Dimargaris verticillata]
MPQVKTSAPVPPPRSTKRRSGQGKPQKAKGGNAQRKRSSTNASQQSTLTPDESDSAPSRRASSPAPPSPKLVDSTPLTPTDLANDSDSDDGQVVLATVQKRSPPLPRLPTVLDQLAKEDSSTAARPVSQIVSFNQVHVNATSRPRIISKSEYVKSPKNSPHSASRKGSMSTTESNRTSTASSPPGSDSRPQSPDQFVRPPKDLRRRSALRYSASPQPDSATVTSPIHSNRSSVTDTKVSPKPAASSPKLSVPTSPGLPSASEGQVNGLGMGLFDTKGYVASNAGLDVSSPKFRPVLETPWDDFQSDGLDADLNDAPSGLQSPGRTPKANRARPGVLLTSPQRLKEMGESSRRSEDARSIVISPRSAVDRSTDDGGLAIRLKSPLVIPASISSEIRPHTREPSARRLSAARPLVTPRTSHSGNRPSLLQTMRTGGTSGEPSLMSPDDEPLASSSYIRNFSSGINSDPHAPEAPVRSHPPARDTKQSAASLGFVNSAYGKFSSLFNRSTSDPEVPTMASTDSTDRQATTPLHSPDSPSSLAPSETSSATSGNAANVDLLLARLEAQNQTLREDPKTARMAKEAFRRSWLMLKEKAGYKSVADSPLGPLAERDDKLSSEPSLSSTTLDEEGQPAVDWQFWGNLINDYEGTVKRHSRSVARHIQQGIPPALRGTLWQLMARSKDPALEQRYVELLDQSTPAEKQIILDLPRTLPHEEFFKDPQGAGQESLFRVLKAYALHDPQVGYCQGIAFIVAPLLMNMPEEEAFCVLIRLMQGYDLREHFTPAMERLHLRLYQLERLTEEQLPLVHRHFIKEGVHTSMFASQWFMTLFAYRFPVQLVFRLFDFVFAEGIETLLKFSLVLLRAHQTQILSLHFEALMEFLTNRMLDRYIDNPTEFLREASKVTCVNSRKLKTLSQDFAAAQARQKMEESELERLRNQVQQIERENRQLQDTLQQLNQEHCDLANTLVQTKLNLTSEQEKSEQLIQDVVHLQAQLQSERDRAEANLQADMESLTQKNWELADRLAQANTQCNDMADQLAHTKMQYAESENDRAILQKKWDDLRKKVGAK